MVRGVGTPVLVLHGDTEEVAAVWHLGGVPVVGELVALATVTLDHTASAHAGDVGPLVAVIVVAVHVLIVVVLERALCDVCPLLKAVVHRGEGHVATHRGGIAGGLVIRGGYLGLGVVVGELHVVGEALLVAVTLDAPGVLHHRFQDVAAVAVVAGVPPHAPGGTVIGAYQVPGVLALIGHAVLVEVVPVVERALGDVAIILVLGHYLGIAGEVGLVARSGYPGLGLAAQHLYGIDAYITLGAILNPHVPRLGHAGTGHVELLIAGAYPQRLPVGTIPHVDLVVTALGIDFEVVARAVQRLLAYSHVQGELGAAPHGGTRAIVGAEGVIGVVHPLSLPRDDGVGPLLVDRRANGRRDNDGEKCGDQCQRYEHRRRPGEPRIFTSHGSSPFSSLFHSPLLFLRHTL